MPVRPDASLPVSVLVATGAAREHRDGSMQQRTLQLWILSDGKPGHENQSLGLAEAMSRRVPCEIHKIKLRKNKLFFQQVKRRDNHVAPDLIIAAGHGTHTTLLWLARRYNVPCVVLMKPTLPTSLFDLCLVPRHDLKKEVTYSDTIIPTHGALNRVSPSEGTHRNGGLFLIGGPSKAHGWDTRSIVNAVEEILAHTAVGPWSLTNSRRTPDDFLTALAPIARELALFPHQQTGTEWLPSRLAAAEEVWVTEDSVSMIYEALTSGARVGLLPVPQLKADSRVNRGIQQLVDDGYVVRFPYWQATHRLLPAPERFHEAGRCADIVLERLFSDSTRR